jgi:hypothetical protein
MHKTVAALLIFIPVMVLVSSLAGCAGAVHKGAPPEPVKPKILIGSSTKVDVEALFGPPTDILTREGEVWVYRELASEDVAGLTPFYCGDKPLVFYFSLDGTVSRISRRVPTY